MKTFEEIRRLIDSGEAQNVEFKAKFEPDKVGQALCALANDWPQTGEGTLIIGIDDKTQEIIGFHEDQNELQRSIANLCRTGMSPPLSPLIHVEGSEKRIMVVETPIFKGKSYRYRNNCYIRIGTTTREATFEDESELKARVEDSHRASLEIADGQFRCDTPPTNSRWVGRSKELASLSYPFKVIFITGIGGQGKSGLASHFITRVARTGVDYEYWDWRDLKEEANRLQSKLVSIIERLTSGKISARLLADQKIDDVIELFFENLGSRKIVFVFDNIDLYVDTQSFLPIEGMAKFINLALNRTHKSKFIFTCRPFIRLAAVDSYQLNLGGLSLEDTKELFDKYRVPLKEDEKQLLAKETYELTSGHPLWLNLIAAQALRGKETVRRFIDDIKSGHSLEDEFSVLTENVLRTVWNTLNQNQRILLRGMSEIVRAERQEVLEKMLSEVLHANRFNKSLKILKSLNLIVVKSAPNEPDLFELHPLVKSFVRKGYSLPERSKYITLLVDHYMSHILVLKPRLQELCHLADFEYWLDKIELDINKEDFVSALSSLEEIASKVITSGYIEDYVRVCRRLFLNLSWERAIREDIPFFHDQLHKCIAAMIEFGESEQADSLLGKYESFCSKTTDANYAEFCSLRAYYYWYRQDFSRAIKWGEQQWDTLKVSNPNCTAPNHLLLAWRDSKEPKNIDRALNGFLLSEKLEDALNDSLSRGIFGPEFYGNIGRCLQFQGKLEEALIIYKKSWQLLSKEKSTNTIINRGYANYWIADILVMQRNFGCACHFYQNAIYKWKQVSPPRSKMAETDLAVLIQQSEELAQIRDKAEWEVEKYCSEYVMKL